MSKPLTFNDIHRRYVPYNHYHCIHHGPYPGDGCGDGGECDGTCRSGDGGAWDLLCGHGHGPGFLCVHGRGPVLRHVCGHCKGCLYGRVHGRVPLCGHVHGTGHHHVHGRGEGFLCGCVCGRTRPRRGLGFSRLGTRLWRPIWPRAGKGSATEKKKQWP